MATMSGLHFAALDRRASARLFFFAPAATFRTGGVVWAMGAVASETVSGDYHMVELRAIGLSTDTK